MSDGLVHVLPIVAFLTSLCRSFLTLIMILARTILWSLPVANLFSTVTSSTIYFLSVIIKSISCLVWPSGLLHVHLLFGFLWKKLFIWYKLFCNRKFSSVSPRSFLPSISTFPNGTSEVSDLPPVLALKSPHRIVKCVG